MRWPGLLQDCCCYLPCGLDLIIGHLVASISQKTSLQNLAWSKGFPGGSDGKESACNGGDLGSIPGLGRSPEKGHDNPLQYSCLENPHGQRSLVGCSPWGRKESDTPERLSTAQYEVKLACGHCCGFYVTASFSVEVASSVLWGPGSFHKRVKAAGESQVEPTRAWRRLANWGFSFGRWTPCRTYCHIFEFSRETENLHFCAQFMLFKKCWLIQIF